MPYRRVRSIARALAHDGRHSHPQGVANRRVSIERKRVQGDIDPVMKPQVFVREAIVEKLDPRLLDAGGCHGVVNSLFENTPAIAQHQQSSGGYRSRESSPRYRWPRA